jgi:hypothetical protein
VEGRFKNIGTSFDGGSGHRVGYQLEVIKDLHGASVQLCQNMTSQRILFHTEHLLIADIIPQKAKMSNATKKQSSAFTLIIADHCVVAISPATYGWNNPQNNSASLRLCVKQTRAASPKTFVPFVPLCEKKPSLA